MDMNSLPLNAGISSAAPARDAAQQDGAETQRGGTPRPCEVAHARKMVFFKWGNGPFDSDPWAVLLVHGLANSLVLPDTQGEERFSLNQFGYYRIPLPAAKDGHQTSPATISPGTAGVDASALCASILQSDLAWEEKKCLLMFRDYQGRTMFEDPRQVARLFVVLEDLVDDTHTLEALIEASNESGSTLLNRVLHSNRIAPRLHWRNAVHPWFPVYVAHIASSRKLPDEAKVRILRAGMRIPVAERRLLAEQSSSHDRILSGRWHEARFHGVSAIDSLFRDDTEYGLQAYMHAILNSRLSNEVKARVLRLDYPDRTGRSDMNAAHLAYHETVLGSWLRKDLKDSLLHGGMSDRQSGCSVM